MASQAEIDLIVDASNTLPQITRDLTRIVRIAEDGADTIDIDVAVSTQASLNRVAADLDRVVAAASNGADDIDIDAVLDQTRTVSRLQEDLSRVIAQAQSGATQDPVQIRAVLDANRSLVSVRGELDRVVTAAQLTTPDIRIGVRTDDDDIRRTSQSLRGVSVDLSSFTRSAGKAVSATLPLAKGIAGIGLAAGAAVPLVAGLAVAIQNIIPAAAVATQGMLAMQLVSGTLKLGMIGVEDAISTAFDPEATPEELAESMKKLAPEAQKFVKALASMKDEFSGLRLDVQNRLFTGLDGSVNSLARSALPQVSDALGRTADTLNEMARGAADAAVEMAANGTLGKALDGTNKGLENLVDVPGEVATAFGQLAAASAPAFDRITQKVAEVATDISERLTSAFESGALEDSIDHAIDLIGQLGEVGGDILGGLVNIFGGLTTNGRDFFTILEEISQAFEDLTASEEFQTILNELALTADALVKNVLPLLLKAFEELGPVFEEIGPPIRDFINQIGPELLPILEELGPVLLDLAKILKEQMPFAIGFTSAVLTILGGVLRIIHGFLENFFIPVTTKVVGAIEKVATSVQFLKANFQTLVDSLRSQILGGINDFAAAVVRRFAALPGQVRGAIIGMVGVVAGVVSQVIAKVRSVPGQIRGVFGAAATILFSAGANIIQGLINGIRSKISGVLAAAADAASAVTSKVKGLLGIHSPSTVMFGVGDDTMQGFINGVESQLPDLNATITQAALSVPTTIQQTVSPIGQRFNTAPAGAPAVFVTIGNQAVDQYVTTRVEAVDRRSVRTAAQGVRR